MLALDGKSARGSAGKEGALHTVSVWSSQRTGPVEAQAEHAVLSKTLEVVLAQQQVPEKTNEITVIPELLEVVNPAGAVVTTDAMGTQAGGVDGSRASSTGKARPSWA